VELYKPGVVIIWCDGVKPKRLLNCQVNPRRLLGQYYTKIH
jgi:hypothetical protein